MKPQGVVTILTALFAASASAQHLAASVLTFDCNAMPNVCENMCWGVNCAGNNQQFKTLTWDNANSAIRRARRTTAGCLPWPNRCSPRNPTPFPAGYNCDEFPFASVQEADLGSQFSRCVPIPENNITPCTSQGAVLAKFFQGAAGCGNIAPCTFSIAFANYVNDPAQSYCAIATPAQVTTFCVNSLRGLAGAVPQQEFANGAPASVAPMDLATSTVSSYKYKLASGDIITTFTKLEIGEQTVKFLATNCTDTVVIPRAVRRRLERRGESLGRRSSLLEDDLDSLETELDMVVEEVMSSGDDGSLEA